MAKKQFKTESKKLLDMMVNSIYTHKEIFLRELISNASDAIDKLHFRSLTDQSVKLKSSDFEIRITTDKDARTLTISDNGCGMTEAELEGNLGVIAKSGSFDFKNNPDNKADGEIDIIGQFGVGFYSAFMVAEKITVESRAYGADEAFVWESEGADGYTIKPCDKESTGTTITIFLKPDTDDENYSEYLQDYKIRMLIKKYSDYIRYPIRMLVEKSVPVDGKEGEYETVETDETLNSMVPLWKKSASDIGDEECNSFYKDKFFDYENPLKVIRQKAEGTFNYEAMLFIPSHAPFDYYSKDFEKGLQLYASGVLIMDKCKDLLGDHFSFVRGLVDSSDLSLNISREMLQHDRQLKTIAKAIEKKIASELSKMLQNDRENYEKFFSAFGTQLKWGIYSSYGALKELLQDLLLFRSSLDNKYVTLKEYISRVKDGQDKIYYASGDKAEKIALLPQVESVISHGYEVLYLTDDVDEFTLSVLGMYDGKAFLNVCREELDLSDDADKEEIKKKNEEAKELLDFLKESLDGEVTKVQLTSSLGTHPVCLSSEGQVSVGMEKILNQMPGADAQRVKAELVLQINAEHPICEKLISLFDSDKELLSKYTKILYSQARLVSGLSIDNPSEFSSLICELLV